jgi:photosystem II stability/assembly factor-like uncharacterized protein
MIAVGGTLLAGVGNSPYTNKVYRSTDNGATWSGWDQGQPGVVDSFTAMGSNIFCGVYYGVYKSVNDGISFSFSGLPPPLYSYVSCMTNNGSRVFVGEIGSQGIYYSDDAGVTWTQSNTGLTDLSILSLHATIGEGVFAATQSGLFKSVDAGHTWLDTGTSGLPVSDYFAGLAENAGTLYVGDSTDGNIYKTENYGATWVLSTSLSLGSQNALAVMNGTIFAGTASGFRALNSGILSAPTLLKPANGAINVYA